MNCRTLCRMLCRYELLFHRTQTLTLKVLTNGWLSASGQASGAALRETGFPRRGWCWVCRYPPALPTRGPVLSSAPLVSGCSGVRWRVAFTRGPSTRGKQVPGIAKTLVGHDSSVKARTGADSSRTGSKQRRARRQEDPFLPEKGVCCEE